MARPKKEKELNHQHIITLRLTDIELKLVMKKAAAAGLSRSEYIRKSLLGGKITVTHKVTAEFPELREEMKKSVGCSAACPITSIKLQNTLIPAACAPRQ